MAPHLRWISVSDEFHLEEEIELSTLLSEGIVVHKTTTAYKANVDEKMGTQENEYIFENVGRKNVRLEYLSYAWIVESVRVNMN